MEDQHFKRQVVSRTFASLLTIITVLIGHFVPDSAHYRMLENSGWIASLSSIVLGVLALLAFLDTVVNDIAPESWRFVCDGRCRMYVWGWMGATYVGYGFVVRNADTYHLIPLFFVMFGLFCFAIAVLDTAHDMKQKESACVGSKPSTSSP